MAVRDVLGRLAVLKIGAVALAGLLGMAGDVRAERGITWPMGSRYEFITDLVVAVDDFGNLTLESEGVFRLWGIDPDAKKLRDYVSSRNIWCINAGRSVSFARKNNILTMCHLVGGNGIDIVEQLINSGSGDELCFETRNMYGTCEVTE